MMPTLLASDTLTTMYGVHPSILGRVTHLFTQDALTPTREDVAQVLALHSKQGLDLELTRAYHVFLLIRAVHTLGIHPYSLNTPPLLTTITGMGKEIIAKNLTADPPDLATTIQSLLALVPDLDLAELDDPTSDSSAPDLRAYGAASPELVVTPPPAQTAAAVITPEPPASLHSGARTGPNQAASPHTWTEVDTTPHPAPPAHPVTDAAPAPAHTWTFIDTTPDQPTLTAPAPSWTEVNTTPDPPRVPEVAPMLHPSIPIGRYATLETTLAQETAAPLTADEVTEPVTGDSVTATTTLTFTAFPVAPAPSVDAADTATPEPHATPAVAHPTFHKNAVTAPAVTAPAASGSVAPSDAHLTPAAELSTVTPDTAPHLVTSPVVTQVIDAPAGEPLPDGPAGAGELPWVAANRDATPDEVMAYLSDHQDVDGALVSLEALQPFRLYMLDLEAFYREQPDQKVGADFTEIREIARVAQEVLLTLTTLTEEDFALLVPEARIIIESASRLLA